MVLRCWFSFLVTLSNVKGIFSASRGESHCAVRDDQGTCRQSEDAEELVALQAKMEKGPHWGWWARGRFHRGRGYYKVQTTTEAPVQPFWISAAVKTPCNEACGEFNDGLNVFRCGKEAMAAINSTEAIEALVAELGLPNTTCTEEGGSRDGGGSPFTRGPPDNDCYYWDPTKPASDIDCDDVSVNKRTPLCYCVPVEPAVPDPTGPWFSADRDQTCNDLCTAKNYTECGKEEMAAINSSVALADLLSILNLTCTPDPSDRKRNGAGSPFTRGPPEENDCYYWNPTETASNIDCISPVAVTGRRPLCYCK